MAPSTADASVSGKFEQVSSESHDEYLNAVGVGLITRKWMSKAQETILIAMDGQQGEITSSCSFRVITHRFTLGQESPEELHDGKCVQSLIVREGNKLTHTRHLGGFDTTIVWEVGASEMTATYRGGDVVATRVYKRIA